ncbi:MAG: hypothetical protein FJ106_07780 [Deltaproteobacteria bacterium]|nr:hypothetical protein [Deltaproteobacteria bacterium]
MDTVILSALERAIGMNRSEHLHRNVSFHKLAKEFQTLSHQILLLANQGFLRPDFQREVSRKILDFSGADEIELWLKDHGKYFRSTVKRQPQEPFLFRIRSSAQNEDGEVVPGPEDDLDHIRLCNNILRGQVDPSKSMLSESGHHPSLFLIPLSVNQKSIGMLQLKSKAVNYFKKDGIELYESLARTLEIAAAHRDAQIDLRERVKELTCLYGIARLASKPEITLEGILRGIVELLPSAWLYPEIAIARIVMDGHSYSTPRFREGKWKQSADIVVHEEIRGRVEIFYAEERPELDEGPFMREERNLLDTVAKEVAIIIVRRQAEQEKLELQEQLRHADRLATIGQLSAGVAHELNEPLGNILGFAQLVKKCPGLPQQAELDIEKILTASLNAREVVKKLLIFARKLPPRKTKVNLNQLVEEGLHFFESRCAKEGIELAGSLSPDLPEILADPAQLNQVIVNLIINALQAMKTGDRLTIRTLAGEEHVSLMIEDTGIGMDEEVMKQIFTPFFTTKDVGQGTGLGLPVVHGIVTSHGGSIKIESKPNQGSRFEIQLPITGSPEV